MPTKTARPMVNAIMAVSSTLPVRPRNRRVGPRPSGRRRWRRGCRAAWTAPCPSRRCWSAPRRPARRRSPAASHLSFGAAMLPRMLVSTIEPATQAHLALEVPALRAAVDRETLCLPGGDPAVEDVHVGQTGRAQRLLGLRGALTGAAHQHDVFVEVRDDLVAVLAQQIQRNVVGPGDVGGLETRPGFGRREPAAAQPNRGAR